MPNLSQQKRMQMLQTIACLKDEHKDDDEVLDSLSDIERAIGEKKYGLVWETHEEKVDIQMQTHIPVFTEDREREVAAAPGLPYNFLLEGDNLHSLYLLEKTHKGKIDVIYIDPPYNRGKKGSDDFIYDNNFIDEHDAFRHSKWLSFMKIRLIMARHLLSVSGVIFISIDDTEQANLKLLCNDVFGEGNFINCFIWQRNSSEKTDKKQFTVNTEYVLLYTKSSEYILNNAYKPLSIASQKMFNKNDNDGRGKYQTVSLQKPQSPGPETTYDYVDNNGKVWKCPAKGWRMKYEKVKALENDNRLVLTGNSLRVKDYWNERDNTGKRIDTLWNDLPQNTAGSSEVEQILGTTNIFTNPKPVGLIKRCLEIGNKNALVLDFFAGSGTTAQAVLELNKADGGNRRFILCTNNENGICENITYPRIKTVITGKRTDGSTYSNGIKANLKYYRCDFVPRSSDNLSDALLKHIAEMIQIENGITLDGDKYIMLLTDAEVDALAAHWSEHKGVKALYVSTHVLLQTEQNAIFKGIEVHTIPEYYFDFDMKTAEEIW